MKPEELVRFELDLQSPSPLTSGQRAELTALAARPDEDIDYSDIPPLPDTFWRSAIRNPLHPSNRNQVTLRLDTEVMEWLEAAGAGYQTKLNAILKRAMIEERRTAVDDVTPASGA